MNQPQEQIEDIRKACIAVNPEIVKPELRKGILCLASNQGERYVASYDVAIHADYEVLEIIGRDIRLADVLLAIQEADTPMGIKTSIMRSLKRDPNEMYLYYRMGDGEIIQCAWNLRTDRLQDQSEETIAFIHSLLKV